MLGKFWMLHGKSLRLRPFFKFGFCVKNRDSVKAKVFIHLKFESSTKLQGFICLKFDRSLKGKGKKQGNGSSHLKRAGCRQR